MPSFDYLALRNRTDRLFDKFGQNVIFEAHAKGAYDPATGTVASTVTTTVVQGVLQQIESRLVANGLVQADSKLLLIRGSDLAAAPVPATDTAEVNGATYRVVRVDEENPGGTTMIWKVYIHT